METTSFSLLELFQLGGVVMWPLLVFSIIVVAISFERIVFLSYHNLEIGDLQSTVSDYIDNDDYNGALDYLSSLTKKRMGARVLLSLMQSVKPGQQFSEHRTERAAETEAMNCVNTLENGFDYLTALGSLSPLTGFLGTVTGMIGAFRSIAEATEVNAQIVANGIYEALITTVFGLIVAIIAMIFHSIFSHNVDRFASRVENTCTVLIAQLAAKFSSRSEGAVSNQPLPAANSHVQEQQENHL